MGLCLCRREAGTGEEASEHPRDRGRLESAAKTGAVEPDKEREEDRRRVNGGTDPFLWNIPERSAQGRRDGKSIVRT